MAQAGLGDFSQETMESHATAILLCDLCAGFYLHGWNMGTGGGVSIQEPDTPLIFLSPSGVHKERMKPADLFLYSTESREYIYKPQGKQPSASAVLFLWLHEHHGAGAVIHTHSMYANLVTRRNAGPWTITGQEYIKGIPNWSTHRMLRNDETLYVPIIENRPTEDQLLPALKECTLQNPDSACVLVRNHGAYHFGKDIWKCKSQTECLEYLFELGWRMRD